MSTRRDAREAVIRAFYLSESRGMSVEEAFAEMEAHDRIIAAGQGAESDAQEGIEVFGFGLDDEQKAFALSIASGIERTRGRFNEQIRAVLKNWDFERISRIDRIIMWIALAEMTYMLDIPVSVSINEAVELAKLYSFPRSTGFINGVLDAVARTQGYIKSDG